MSCEYHLNLPPPGFQPGERVLHLDYWSGTGQPPERTIVGIKWDFGAAYWTYELMDDDHTHWTEVTEGWMQKRSD